MAFFTEPEPTRDAATPVAPGIQRIVADNAGPMTYHGTNTYLMEGPDGLTVLDPGPPDEKHIQTILRIGNGRIKRILVTHRHMDHFGAALTLRQKSGAQLAAFAVAPTGEPAPDTGLQHGDVIAGLRAIHTPGHAFDHLCFARDDGVVFTGDHVMSWSSSVVSPPPRGNMRAYLDSLGLLLAHGGVLYLPGHGPVLPEPATMVRDLLQHRLMREAAIVTLLEQQSLDITGITRILYKQKNPTLHAAAERNVAAHLAKLADEGRVIEDNNQWRVTGLGSDSREQSPIQEAQPSIKKPANAVPLLGWCRFN